MTYSPSRLLARRERLTDHPAEVLQKTARDTTAARTAREQRSARQEVPPRAK